MKVLSAFGRLASRLGAIPVCFLACLTIASTSTINAQNYRISTGDDYGAVIDAEGNLFLWGAIIDESGNLEQIDGIWREVSVSRTAAGEAHILLIASNGTLWAFGNNNRGQLGVGDQDSRTEPVQISNATSWVEVAAGREHSLARNDSGLVYAWGDNSLGQLNVRPIYNNPARDMNVVVPNAPIDFNSYISIAAGNAHSHAIRDDHTLWAWGSGGAETNGGPELGLLFGGSFPIGPIELTQVGTDAGWSRLFGGYHATFALKDTLTESGQLWVWGSGGNLGVNDPIVETPRRVGNGTNWVHVSHSTSPGDGNAHALALKSDQSLYGWGTNYPDGQLGLPLFDIGGRLISENTRKETPTRLESTDTFLAVGAGDGFSVVVNDGGFMLTAGRNDVGQLANGTVNSNAETGQDFFDNSQLGAVDLSIESLSFSSTREGLKAGDTIEVQLLVRNSGTGTVESADLAALEYGFALSPGLSPGAAGERTPVATTPVYSDTEIGPASAVAASFTITIPEISAGDYFILAEVDTTDVLKEGNEDNNRATSDPDAPLLFRADLQVTFANATPRFVDTGDTLSVAFSITNAGTGDILAGAGSAFGYRIILSDQDDGSFGDIYELLPTDDAVELVYNQGLAAGETSPPVGVRLRIPEEVDLSKSYYVGLIVDSGAAIEESDESNNRDFSANAMISVNGLSIPEALDVLGDPDKPAFSLGGDSSWYGQPNVSGASGTEGGAARSPSLEAGEIASLTFSFAEPRELSFRWKSATTSFQNRLFFGANRVPLLPEDRNDPVSLSGFTNWSDVSFVVPANTPVGFFYEQGIAAEDDRVFVDNFRVSTPIEKPDYVIDDIQFEPGEFMLRRDQLSVTVTGINRGADFDLPEDFSVSVWLSRDIDAGDADDVLLGNLNAFQVLNNGAEFVYRADFVLPDELADADYFVLARVDSGNVVTEFNESTPFSDTDNNFAVSEEASVSIIRAANLRVTRLVGNGELPEIFVGGPANHPEFDPEAGQGDQTVFGTFFIEPLPGEESELELRFDVINEGLAPVEAQDYSIRVFMTTGRDADPADGITLFEFVESAGLAIGGGKTFEITTNIPDTVPPGQFYLVGVQVDSLQQVLESDEIDNVTRSNDRDVFVGEVPLEVALNDLLPDPSSRHWNDGFPGAVEDSQSASPWFGQSDTVQLDSATAAAAQSGPVPIGGRTEMTTVVDVTDSPRLISFFWKVSSQLDPPNGQFDVLVFDIREGSSGPFQTIAGPISGEVDWTKVEHTITESGSYTLRWSYIESGDGVRRGADAGWVDNFSAAAPDFVPMDPASRTVAGNPDSSETPGFRISSTELKGNTADGILVPGDTVTVEFDVRNMGDGFFDSVPAQIRLTRSTGSAANLNWTSPGASDVILLRDTRLDVADGSGTGGFSRTFTVPDSLSEAGDFFVGVWLDFREGTSETSETNNLQFSENFLTLEPLFTLNQALDTEGPSWSGDGREWILSGQSRWFPVEEKGNNQTIDGEDSLRSPTDLGLGESAILERVVEGPVLLEFQWKAETTPEQNFLELRINGISQFREFGPGAGSALRISGDVDWRKEIVLVPAGQQIVSFVYVRNSDENPGDVVRVDQISRSPVTAPDLAIVPSGVSFNSSPDPETGIQTFALERDAFPLSVTVVNRGATPSGFNYNDLDVEVRFSEDREIGPEDRILGNLALSDVLDGGQRSVFGGSVELPLDLPAQRYFLLLRVNALDPNFTELEVLGTEAQVKVEDKLFPNNFFASAAQSIEVVHLPRLDTELDGDGVLTEKVYYPKESIRLDWKLLNIGLGDIGGDGSTSYDQTIQLWAFPPGTTQFTVDNAEIVRDMHVENERAFLPGVLNRQSLEEGTIRYQTELTIPRAGELLNEIGEIEQEQEDENVEVVSALGSLETYTFFFVIVRDTTIPQSSDLSIRLYPSHRFRIAAFPYDVGDPNDTADTTFISFEDTVTTYEEWRDFNLELLVTSGDLARGVTIPTKAEGDFYPGSGNIENLFYYALNLPLKPKNRLNQGDAGTELNRAGTMTVGGQVFRRVTFPIIRGATDLRYIVEASDGPDSGWEEILAIDPPFLDSRGGFQAGYFGAQSLTGPEPSALINQSSPSGDGYLPVTGIIDQNYTAKVTVRDYKPVGTNPSRTMRLRIQTVPMTMEVFLAFVNSSNLPDALGDAVPLGDDWHRSNWLGAFAYDPNSGDSWVFSVNLGWLYVNPAGSSVGVWLFSSKLNSWLWGGSSLNGFYYDSKNQTWVFLSPNPNGTGAWLYQVSSGTWEFVKP